MHQINLDVIDNLLMVIATAIYHRIQIVYDSRYHCCYCILGYNISSCSFSFLFVLITPLHNLSCRWIH